jgi:predicted 2-oxoglutarate/Fe(II)-dependent dioxygenase YbiX
MIQYFTIQKFLTEEQCNEIVNYSLQNLKFRNGLVGANEYNEKSRKSSISFTNYDDVFPYIKEKLLKEISKEIKIKGYKINFDNQLYQFTKYDVGEFYNWHTDSSTVGFASERYCSIVIQLNDEYKGGDLELIKDENGEIFKFENGKGNLFVFLSNMTHRVTEVTENTRYSLVNWFRLLPDTNYKKTLI